MKSSDSDILLSSPHLAQFANQQSTNSLQISRQVYQSINNLEFGCR